MEQAKKNAAAYIDANASVFTEVSHKIWEYAELSLKEFRSAALYCDTLRALGFTVTEKLGGMDTAFCGSYGAGRPVIGILGEFDALSGLSQKAGAAVREAVNEGGSGHGCGHNMLGAGALAAAAAVKNYLETSGKEGTVIFFGCPGEEGGAGKAFLARARAWEKLDAALTWHPDDHNRVVSGSCIACIQKEYTFTGIAAHAAGSPENGRSGLDAAELMNIGVQFLREHMPSTARVHYAVTDGGGVSPNVVQPAASMLYMVRDSTVQSALALQARVDKIAQGAALMTETALSIRFIDGCANTVANEGLEKLLYKNFAAAELPVYTVQEQALAAALAASCEVAAKPLAQRFEDELDDDMLAEVEQKSEGGHAALNNFVMPYQFSKKVRMGSTDVGDVSWQTPTAQINAVGFAAGSPGHSWQNVACGATSIGDKGLLLAGRTLAATAIELMEDPALLEPIRAEFLRRTKAGYQCPIPPEAEPVAL